MSVLQYRSRRGVHTRRAPLSLALFRGNSALALEDKFDDIKKLIDAGKEKGYLTYNEVNDLIPHDLHSPDDLEDLLTTIGTQGIDVLEGPKLPGSLDKKFDTELEAGEDVELDLTPGALEKPTTRFACTCVRWARSRCSPAKAKSRSPSASSAGSCVYSKRCRALRS